MFRAGLTNNGKIGSLLNNLLDNVNDFECKLLGPSLLIVRFDSKGCRNGIFLPSLFKSQVAICQLYKQLPQNGKMCFTDAAIEVRGRLRRIIGGGVFLNRCCRMYMKNV